MLLISGKTLCTKREAIQTANELKEQKEQEKQEEEKKNQEPKQEEGGRIFRYMYIV